MITSVVRFFLVSGKLSEGSRRPLALLNSINTHATRRAIISLCFPSCLEFPFFPLDSSTEPIDIYPFLHTYTLAKRNAVSSLSIPIIPFGSIHDAPHHHNLLYFSLLHLGLPPSRRIPCLTLPYLERERENERSQELKLRGDEVWVRECPCYKLGAGEVRYECKVCIFVLAID